jgi:hypothetical protein
MSEPIKEGSLGDDDAGFVGLITLGVLAAVCGIVFFFAGCVGPRRHVDPYRPLPIDPWHDDHRRPLPSPWNPHRRDDDHRRPNPVRPEPRHEPQRPHPAPHKQPQTDF